MTYRVRFQARAKADVRNIVRYIKQHSVSGAAAWLSVLENARQKVGTNADGYGLCDEASHFEIDVRQFLFKTRRGRTYRSCSRSSATKSASCGFAVPGRHRFLPVSCEYGNSWRDLLRVVVFFRLFDVVVLLLPAGFGREDEDDDA